MRRDCYKQKIHWRKLGVWSIVSFHWLNCDCLSLAEFSTGKGKIFLLLLVLSRVTFCWRPKLLVLHDSSPFWPSDCILVRFHLINFHISPFWSRYFSKSINSEEPGFFVLFFALFCLLPAFNGLLSLSARKNLYWAPCPTSEGKNAD